MVIVPWLKNRWDTLWQGSRSQAYPWRWTTSRRISSQYSFCLSIFLDILELILYFREFPSQNLPLANYDLRSRRCIALQFHTTFQKPERPESWDGVKPTKRFSKSAVQAPIFSFLRFLVSSTTLFFTLQNHIQEFDLRRLSLSQCVYPLLEATSRRFFFQILMCDYSYIFQVSPWWCSFMAGGSWLVTQLLTEI